MSSPLRPAYGPAPARSGGRLPGRVAVRWLRRVLLGTLVVGVLVVGGTAFRVWQVARIDDRRPVDVVVVLGAAQYDGKPSSIFGARLRHAKDLYEQGDAKRIVTVGGAGMGDVYTEAGAGRKYLIDLGVPADAVTAVGEGGDTLSSMRAVAQLAQEHRWATALLVSDPWHSLRARTMARDAGLEAWTSPTRTGPVVQTRETQARYIVRETAALLYYRLTQAPAETDQTGSG